MDKKVKLFFAILYMALFTAGDAVVLTIYGWQLDTQISTTVTATVVIFCFFVIFWRKKPAKNDTAKPSP